MRKLLLQLKLMKGWGDCPKSSTTAESWSLIITLQSRGSISSVVFLSSLDVTLAQKNKWHIEIKFFVLHRTISFSLQAHWKSEFWLLTQYNDWPRCTIGMICKIHRGGLIESFGIFTVFIFQLQKIIYNRQCFNTLERVQDRSACAPLSGSKMTPSATQSL